MARIGDAELTRMKREISVQRLAEAQGVKLKKHGKDLMGLCPFHDDREPSLVVTPSKNLWHCLGACQTGGGPLDWVMRAQGVSFRHAAELLRADHPSLAAPVERGRGGRPPADGKARKVPDKSSTPKLDVFAEPEERDEVVLGRVVAHYVRTLKDSPEALAYLASRGLSHPELIERFQLGFANRTLSYRLPDKSRKAGAALRAQLQRLGVLRDSGHEHLNGSLVVPIFDAEGRVVEMYGRKITAGLRKGTPLHLYLPGPHRGVWNLEALQASKEVILCESLIDAMTFWCAGYRNVTASYGVEGFTKDHWAAFAEHGVERVLIAYDRDEAGDKSADKLAAQLGQAGIGSYRVQFPKGMDANEYALKVQPADKVLGTAIRSARWVGEGKPVELTTRSVTAGEPSIVMPAPEPVTEAVSAAQADPLSSLAAEPAFPVAPAPAVSPPTLQSTPSSGPGGTAVDAEVSEEQVVIELGDRRWRIRGLGKNLSYEQLKVNVLVARGDAFHVDQVELYAARQRALFLKAAAQELQLEERVLKHDLGKVLLKLEALQHAQIQSALEPKAKAPVIGEAERKAALSLLKDPKLMERILSDYERCGVVGERDNKLLGYLAAVSRKLDEPLAIVIQSSSAAGKSSLMDAILSFVPEEERVSYSAMTGQSLFYMGESDLAHKILSIAEEEGASNASYALKLLQSEGELTIASTGKDPGTGRLVTHEYRVQGPVQLFLTTTAIEVDEELLNRCVVLTVDEGRQQTQAIHALQRQRRTLQGVLDRQDRGQVMALHQNAQRLLRPLFVVNPFADKLRFPDHATRTRRDHKKYLTLIEAVALLHQYQRPVKEVEHRGARLRYIEVTQADLEMADRLLPTVLGHTLGELPPQTQCLLGLVQGLVQERAKTEGMEPSDVRFTRRDVREHTGWGHTQLKVHLGRLVELELLLLHRGRHSQRQEIDPMEPKVCPASVGPARGALKRRPPACGGECGVAAP